MKLAVIIVNYNVKHYLEMCIYSLQKALERVDAQIFIVDNCSVDDSVAYLTSLFPDVHFINNTENIGFARANNKAINETESDYILLLNPDTMVSEETVYETLSFMEEHPQAGALGVKMLNTDGSIAKESRRGVPSPITAFYKMCGLCDRFPANRKFAHYYMSYLSWDEPAKIEIVSGAFCMLRRKALKETGLLDEAYFMYGEDIDLSYRILKNKWEVWYYPSAILHYKGESTQKTSYRYVHTFYQAMLIFFKKHYSHLNFFFSTIVHLAIYLKAFLALVNNQISKLYNITRITNVNSDVIYLFVIDPRNKSMCNKIIQQNSLNASFMSSFEEFNYNNLMSNKLYYIIFDLRLFACKQIFQIMSYSPHSNIKMGFFKANAHLIITENNVFKDE